MGNVGSRLYPDTEELDSSDEVSNACMPLDLGTNKKQYSTVCFLVLFS